MSAVPSGMIASKPSQLWKYSPAMMIATPIWVAYVCLHDVVLLLFVYRSCPLDAEGVRRLQRIAKLFFVGFAIIGTPCQRRRQLRIKCLLACSFYADLFAARTVQQNRMLCRIQHDMAVVAGSKVFARFLHERFIKVIVDVVR
jgi:hypothetical protein